MTAERIAAPLPADLTPPDKPTVARRQAGPHCAQAHAERQPPEPAHHLPAERPGTRVGVLGMLDEALRHQGALLRVIGDEAGPAAQPEPLQIAEPARYDFCTQPFRRQSQRVTQRCPQEQPAQARAAIRTRRVGGAGCSASQEIGHDNCTTRESPPRLLGRTHPSRGA